jgi:hypothetical protein
MTVEELIEELRKLPPNTPVFGYAYGHYSSRPELLDVTVKVNADGYIEFYDEFFHVPEGVLIDFR